MNETLSIARESLLFPGLEVMRGYSVRASDGAIGHVHDWYFDDVDWVVRYLVVDHGHWLPGRRTLITPSVIGTPDERKQELPVSLRRRQVETSPEWDRRLPVSRRHLEDLRRHYGWPGAWPTSAMAGTLGMPGSVPPLPAEPGDARRAEEARTELRSAAAHLQSLHEVTGYSIHATDGEIGRVADLLCGQDPWRIRYLEARTRRWWPGHHVLLPVSAVREIDWVDGQVRMGISRDHIRHSPVYDPHRPLGHAYEQALHQHYELPRYWDAGRSDRR